MAGRAAAGFGGDVVTLAYGYGALALLAALIVGALLSRHMVTPVAPRPTRLLMRPGKATDVGWCPAEKQERLHEYHADGSRTCWTCRTTSPAGVPRG